MQESLEKRRSIQELSDLNYKSADSKENVEGRESTMKSWIRDTLLVGMAAGAFGLAACANQSPTTGVQATPMSTETNQARIMEEEDEDPCPLDAEQRDQVMQLCKAFSQGEEGEEDPVALVPIRIGSRPSPLDGCACEPSVTLRFCDGTPEDCFPGDGSQEPPRTFLGQDVIFGATVEGSTCKEICSSGTGGTVSVNEKCLAICRASR